MSEMEGMDGLSIGGNNIKNFRYADDTVLVADFVEKLQALVDVIKRASEEKELKIIREKAECKMVSKRSEMPVCPIQIETEIVDKFEQFQYLGSVVTADAWCTSEKKIGIAKTAFRKMVHLPTNCRVRVQTRKRATKTYVWSLLLYDCHALTVSGEIEARMKD